jgi:hypothetical protein
MNTNVNKYNEMYKFVTSEKKDFLKVEPRHLEEISKLTDKGQEQECDLEIGIRFDDCIALKKAAEQMGYEARILGGYGYEGYPSKYHLIKIKKNQENNGI